MAGYHVYLKLKGRKRFGPMGEDMNGQVGVVANLLCAFVYTVNTEEEKAKLENYAKHLKTSNPGSESELRIVKGW